MTPGGWRCTRRVGFLFPHPCERSTPEGCRDCANGSIADPWASRTDRRGYANDYYVFDDVGSDEPGGFSDAPIFGGGDSAGGGASMDFSEADGAELTNSGEAFEDDLSAS